LLRHSNATDGTGVRSVTDNISRGGVYLVGKGNWKVGAQIECVIQLPDSAFGKAHKWIRSRGRVIYIKPLDREKDGIGATIDQFEFVDSVK
jgi:hypothetical protein